MKDKINIEIEIEKLNSNPAKINDLIREFALKLGEQEGIVVLKYPRIETKFVGKENGKAI